MGKTTGKQNDAEAKRCFVISPLGHEGSAVRARADRVFRHVIEPAVKECGYLALRSDIEPMPGMIGQQIIMHLLRDDLVVADLTGLNANVFYELAIRHMARKPVVQLMEEGGALPFDITQSRTIFLDSTDLDSADACRIEIITQIRELEREPDLVQNPVSYALETVKMRQSEDEMVRRDGEILERLDRLSYQVEMLLLDNRLRYRRGLHHPAFGDAMEGNAVSGDPVLEAQAGEIVGRSVTLDRAVAAYRDLRGGGSEAPEPGVGSGDG